MKRSTALHFSARKKKASVRHWDLMHEMLEQDSNMGINKTVQLRTPWPYIPPVDTGTFEQDWVRYRNVAKLVANGTIQPPKWYRQSRLAPPTSGPFWGDPPVHSMEHQYPLRRHFHTMNLKPPTELMKAFMLRKEDVVMEKNYKRIVGFTPREKVRQRLKEDTEAAAHGRSTFSFFWQRKPLERMERRFHALREEGVPEGDAHATVSREFHEMLAVRKRQQNIAAETARRSGKAISAFQGQWVLELLSTLQRTPLDRSQTAEAGEELSLAAAHHTPYVVHGEQPDTKDQDPVAKATTRYLEYTGLQPDLMAFDFPVVGQHRAPIFESPAQAVEATKEEAEEVVDLVEETGFVGQDDSTPPEGGR